MCYCLCFFAGEAGSSSSSGPQRLSQQSSQQPAEEESQQSSQQTGAEKIFQSDAVLTKEIGKRSKEELLALGIEVLRSRGQDWMREQLDRRDRDLVKKLAGKAGIQVKVQGRAKLRDVLVGELMELFASATAACCCMVSFCSLSKWFYRVCRGAWVCLCVVPYEDEAVFFRSTSFTMLYTRC